MFLCRHFKDIEEPKRHFSLTSEEIRLINPNTLTCPVFRTKTDAELTKSIAHRIPILVNEKLRINSWDINFLPMFHVSNDSELFRTEFQLNESGFELNNCRYIRGKDIYIPMYEGKMIYVYDHRYATFDAVKGEYVSNSSKKESTVKAQLWAPLSDANERLEHRNWNRSWLFGIRRIARSTDERGL